MLQICQAAVFSGFADFQPRIVDAFLQHGMAFSRIHQTTKIIIL
jgi:hypothetical protein